MKCPTCGTTAPDTFLACPSCHRLFFADELAKLHAEAGSLEVAEDLVGATEKLRSMLELLPTGAGQAAKIRERIASLEERLPAARAKNSRAPAWLAGLGAGGLMLWKIGGPILLVLSKLKFLFVGLFQAKTLLSFLFSASLYEHAGFGGSALLFLGSIYVHEVGHIWAFRRYGIAVTAPMFVPGFGAFVRGSHYPEAKVAAADVALAGPIWGTVSGYLALAVAASIGSRELALGAVLIAEMNLFNLLPVWHLDGSRAIDTLDRRQRLVLGGVGLPLLALAGSWMGIAASVGHLVRAFVRPGPPVGEPRSMRQFIAVMVALAVLRGAAAWLASG